MTLSSHTARALVFPAALVLLCACSTTRVLPEGSLRLARNEIRLTEKHKGLDAEELRSYLKQKENTLFLGMSPAVSIYNWRDGKGGTWDDIVTRL